jgi:hypothetical protein
MTEFIFECVLASLPWRVLCFVIGLLLIALAIYLHFA